MNPPIVKVPMPGNLSKDERDFFRTPSAPRPLLNPSLASPQITPSPSPLPWYANHPCGGGQSYASHMNSPVVSSSWDTYHQYFKAATSPSSSFGNLSLYGLSCSSPLLTPLPAHAHSSGSASSSYFPLDLKSPNTTSMSPPAAHSYSDRPFMSSPGIYRPIPSRPSSSATPLVIPRVDLDGETRTSKVLLKSEDKPPGPIKSEPEYLNDSDSAFEDGEGSFTLCSRTTPVNHKSIKKWRQRSTPSFKPISVNTSTPMRPRQAPQEPGAGPLSAPGSLSSSWSSPFSSSPSHMSQSYYSSFSSDSGLSSSSLGDSKASINKSSSNMSLMGFTPSKNSKPSDSIPVGIAVARLRPSHDKIPDTEDISLKKEPIKELSYPLNIPKVPCPLPSKDSSLLPLGYQWAKDPITGQIYFLPSNPIWTSNPGYGYLQWQQDAWLAHQHLQLSLSGLNIPSQSPFVSQMTSSSVDISNPQKEESSVPPESIIHPQAIRVPSPASTTDEKISVGGREDEPRESSLEEHTQMIVEAIKEKDVKTEVPDDSKPPPEGNSLNGLELLTEGISRMETDSAKDEEVNEDEEDNANESNKNNLSILIDAADTLEASPSKSSLRSEPPVKVEPSFTPSAKLSIPSDLNRNYRSPEAEKEAKAFIASKAGKSPGICRNSSDEMDVESPKRASIEDMEAWEIGMRMNLAEIQRKYKEKYKELYKLQKSSIQSRRRKSSSDSGTFTSKKIKTEKVPEKDWSSPGSFSDTFVRKYKPDNGSCSEMVNAGDLPYNWVPKKKLFLSPSQRKSNTDVTLFSDKFKHGRPSPFENLLRLSKNRQSLDDDDDQSEEIIKDDDDDEEESKSRDLNLEDDVIDEREIIGDEKVIPKVFVRAEECESRSVEEPLKTEDVVASVKPEVNSSSGEASSPPSSVQANPLVVSPLKIKKSFVSDSEEFECQQPKKKSKKSKKYKKNKKDKKLKKVRKMKVSVIRTPPTSSCLDITLEKSTSSSSASPPPSYSKFKVHRKKSKWSTSDEEDDDIDDTDLLDPKNPEDCVLSEHDLRDGLRVLTKIEGHFHPSTIKAISPPDIYGVIVDKERGNKPHIFSREEVLKAAIYEVKPSSIEDVPIGTRVCAYWSQKYNHLYPGTIGEPGSPNPKLDPNFFVNVELDDGDSRDIHIDSVRYLPPHYPLVQYEPDPMAFGVRRKRMFSTDSALSTSSISSTKTNDAKDEYSHRVSKTRRESNHLTKVIIKSSDLKFKIRSSPDLAPEPNLKPLVNNKSSMAAFLPAQQLWCWADEGIKKGRRVIHNSIKRDDDETLSVGTCAVFLSTGRPDRPYIGRLESLWETQGSNSMRNMRVKVRWFYHACETKGKSKDGSGESVENLRLPGALFESYHFDENDVQTISHGCDVISVSKFVDKLSEEPSRLKTIYENNDLYYLAGNYDPVEENIEFYPKVFEDFKV